jgi:hypothetical protein
MEPALELASPNDFECFHCHKVFQGSVYEIVSERCRLHFDEQVPYVESENLCGFECYCSRACLESRVANVMARENVPITHPGMSRVANCAACQSPVDRTDFHRAYLATLSEPLDDITWETVEMDCLAVTCEKCSSGSSDE